MHQNIFLLRVRHVGVNLRRADGAVTEHSLYVANINVLLQQEGGEGVAEHVRGDVLVDTGELRVTVYHKADGLVGQLAVQTVHEKISAECNVVFEGFLVQCQRVDDLMVADLDDSFPRALSVNQDVAALEVDVGRLQRAQLGYSHSGGEQQLDDGDVPDATAKLIVGFGRRLLRIQH